MSKPFEVRVGLTFNLVHEGKPVSAEIIHREKKKWRGKIWWRTRLRDDEGTFIMKTHTDELIRIISEEAVFIGGE